MKQVALASCRLSREPALSLPKGRLALGAPDEESLPSAVNYKINRKSDRE